MIRPWFFFGAAATLFMTFAAVSVRNVIWYTSFPAEPLRWAPQQPSPDWGTWVEISSEDVRCDRLFVQRTAGPRQTVIETTYVPVTDALKTRVALLEFSSPPNCSALTHAPVRGVWTTWCMPCTLDAYLSALAHQDVRWPLPVGIIDTRDGPSTAATGAASFGFASLLTVIGMVGAYRRRRQPSMF